MLCCTKLNLHLYKVIYMSMLSQNIKSRKHINLGQYIQFGKNSTMYLETLI